MPRYRYRYRYRGMKVLERYLNAQGNRPLRYLNKEKLPMDGNTRGYLNEMP
jgi:Zn/Cd-binding protein ZinT